VCFFISGIRGCGLYFREKGVRGSASVEAGGARYVSPLLFSAWGILVPPYLRTPVPPERFLPQWGGQEGGLFLPSGGRLGGGPKKEEVRSLCSSPPPTDICRWIMFRCFNPIINLLLVYDASRRTRVKMEVWRFTALTPYKILVFVNELQKWGVSASQR